ncbi:MAG: TIGR03842 family LLM class F420-dependent oxidoreductase [Candidatus Dormibacteraeota bacterium]|nr:TIGR03842 family LLM class F420-dependent oxidoreductase [Candidatus Dormibacteraeota bacterium]
MLGFGVTFQADPPVSRVVEWARVAERTGHEAVWLWDSHVLWQEVYPIFTLIAAGTSRIHIGPCVTNPATRDPSVTASVIATLQEISGGRMEIGIGRGDSAQRVMGRHPVTLERLEATCRVIRDLVAGREVTYEGAQFRLAWATGAPAPIWVAGYGPRALRVAGRVGDGVILQLADPDLIRWFLRFVREGAEAAGRRFEDIQVQAAAPAYVSADLAHARDQVRWFPALVSNHVVDLLRRYGPEEMPHSFTDYIRTRDHYDYAEHGRAGSEQASFVPDEIVDRFCVLGTVDECRAKLAELEAAGVTQFNNYDMGEDPAGQMEIFGRELIPRG